MMNTEELYQKLLSTHGGSRIKANGFEEKDGIIELQYVRGLHGYKAVRINTNNSTVEVIYKDVRETKWELSPVLTNELFKE